MNRRDRSRDETLTGRVGNPPSPLKSKSKRISPFTLILRQSFDEFRTGLRTGSNLSRQGGFASEVPLASKVNELPQKSGELAKVLTLSH
jgi:hypothetical protein